MLLALAGAVEFPALEEIEPVTSPLALVPYPTSTESGDASDVGRVFVLA
jgi:hypothetical protein